ncbi:MAG TPA: PTS sugar transporter subunit IIC [Longimicrobiales bacterium]|nr:PTS sugar transporter subunit IIC [Longimicrobiales bacterium]
MNWLAVSLFGGLVGIDATSVAQTMISRPIAAATLTGVMLGRPVEALFLGSMLELFALVILPVGAARYPEAGTAAVAAVAAYCSATAVLSPAVALLAVLFALLWEHVGGASVVLVRRFNESYVSIVGEAAPDRVLERRHRMAMLIDFVRAVLITLTGVLFGSLALRGLAQLWSLDAFVAPAILSIGICCMVGAALPLFGGLRAQKLAFGIGLTVGLLFVLLR